MIRGTAFRAVMNLFSEIERLAADAAGFARDTLVRLHQLRKSFSRFTGHRRRQGRRSRGSRRRRHRWVLGQPGRCRGNRRLLSRTNGRRPGRSGRCRSRDRNHALALRARDKGPAVTVGDLDLGLTIIAGYASSHSLSPFHVGAVPMESPKNPLQGQGTTLIWKNQAPQV